MVLGLDFLTKCAYRLLPMAEVHSLTLLCDILLYTIQADNQELAFPLKASSVNVILIGPGLVCAKTVTV